MLIEDTLAEICEIVGIASCLEDAMSEVSWLTFDAAILDVDLDGKQTYPVAEALARRGIPFVLATGYGASGVLEDLRRNVPLLASRSSSASWNMRSPQP